MGKKKDKKQRDRFQVLSVEVGEKDVNPATGHAEINLRFDLVNGTQDGNTTISVPRIPFVLDPYEMLLFNICEI
jgi:hypothetical protein